MIAPEAAMVPIVQRLRSGDLAGARKAAETAIADYPQDMRIIALLGMVTGELGDDAAAAGHFRNALKHNPADVGMRHNLAMALTRLGDHEEAAKVAAAAGDPRLDRIAGYALQQTGRLGEAIAHYRRALAAMPDDYEGWNNLGNACAQAGDGDGAIAAFERAINLKPDLPVLYINLSKALMPLDRAEDRQRVMRIAADVAPEDAEVQAELGLAEAGARDFVAAEAALRRSIKIAPAEMPAYVDLGLMLENLNRIDDLEALIEQADAAGLKGGEVDFLRAWLLRRRGDLDGALQLAERTPDTISPVRRSQMIAELSDRKGDVDRAFAAFGEMNAAAAIASPPLPGDDYPAEVAEVAAMLTAEKIAGWSRIVVDQAPPPPVFILGFPRSGTTLLDTLLMNVPHFHVLEELPVARQIEHALGPQTRISEIDSAEANALRRRYFESLEIISPPPQRDMTVIDKYPLHMARAPLLHRVFPDAKFIFVERHPCDVVLSCFMANFQLNRAMRCFGTIEDAAALYDIVSTAWTRACDLLPMDVHTIRYERMVEDLDSEMRALLEFLGEEWRPEVLDNQGAASRRDHIRTASYSQVGEPIYKRAAGRWERYRRHMEPVLPVLEPWVSKLGYSL